MTVALLCAALAAALPAAAAMAGTPELAAVLLVEQLAFGWAWVAVLRASRPTVLLLAAAALTADGAVLGATRHDLGSIAGVIGAGLAVVIVYQLFRRRRVGVPSAPASADDGSAAPPPASARVTAELAAALGGGTLVAFLAGLLALRAQPGAPAPGDLLVAVGLAGIGGAVLVAWLAGLLGAGSLLAGGLGLAAGTGLGAGYGGLVDELSAGSGALLAAAGALAAAVMGVLVARAGPALAASAADGTVPVASGPQAKPSPDRTSARLARRERADAGLGSPAVLLAAGGVRVRPFPARSVAAVLLAAVAPLTVAAPLVYLVGRHLPG
ncbi:hypothetical protein I6A60_27480 [Frankia sp. AgB1.9]|uniref:hypothetical protein n=1 Tax=unclassified Frankia TaxID=2632575 RepID=UPI001933ABF3|nr:MULTISPECIES: hypothetical protein [unclassified Frankia]MBL7491220.1 hypothetical protein [Frankia sp. AgW1.1]MBL7551571.1 hypothetical protein [Frankia sp. AgB1.9]MBL7621722.1 hypothetical protein [Frankia sp. AgB1.8]